jgi:6-pyruvoyltetrahydropterin/6-carboxytetrahydropterin synthase
MESAMYAIAVKRDFIAQHYLIGGDWGAENQLHSHHYQVEVRLEASGLDRHGYLVDIVEIERNLEDLLARYRDRTLNDLEEFEGLNPSLEHFTRLLWVGFASRLSEPRLEVVAVRLWENEIAWAEYRAAPDGA